ncbi:MAG: disulfide bond formation protein B, partial [Acidimicrobiia bacterium]
ATNFFTVLTIVANVVVVLIVAFGVAALVSSSARRAWTSMTRAVGTQAVLVAWLVAVVTTAGSLYYSEHLGFLPCELCWYQRILMYPLVIVLGVAVLNRDRFVWITGLVFVVLGVPLSLYHWLVERVPSLAESTSCSVTAPCSAPYFEKFGYVTLAWMCMSSFLLIGSLLVISATVPKDTSATATPDHEESAPTVDAPPDSEEPAR